MGISSAVFIIYFEILGYDDPHPTAVVMRNKQRQSYKIATNGYQLRHGGAGATIVKINGRSHSTKSKYNVSFFLSIQMDFGQVSFLDFRFLRWILKMDSLEHQ